MKAEFLIVLCYLPIIAMTQEQSPAKGTPTPEPWLFSLMLRKGLETKDEKDKPAAFSVTWPKDDKPASYLLNSALGLNISHIFKGKSQLNIIPSVVYNRNNQVKKEQHNFKSLVSIEYLIGKENTDKKTYSRVMIFPTVQHMWNHVDTSRSFFGTLYGTWLLKKNKFSLNGYTNVGKSGLLYYVGLIPGFEYQDRYNVKKTGIAGNILRFYWATDLRLAVKTGNPANQSLGFKLVELSFNFAQRNEITGNLPVSEGTTHLLRTELSFFPARSENVSLGLSYNEGEDPIAAVEKQNYWQLTFKLKLDFKIPQ